MNIESLVKCNLCGEIFPHDELQLIEEHGCYESDCGVYDEFDNHTYYDCTNTVCPYCGSDNYNEGYRCNECEEYTSHLEDYDYGICSKCSSKYTEEEYNIKYPEIK